MRYLGLDLETSGTDPDRHAPIQLGLAHLWDEEPTVKSWDIGNWSWHNEPWTAAPLGARLAEWSPKAEEVHGITQDRVRNAPSPALVDGYAEAFLKNLGTGPAGTIAVGWNIASFDFRFLRRWLPRTEARLSYRTVDLNALVFTLAGDDKGAYYSIKEDAKNYASDAIAQAGVYFAPLWHDAGYDALASLYAWEYLKTQTKGYDYR